MSLLNGLIAHWPLSDVNDIHGENHLTNTGNTTTFVPGKVGNAAFIDGIADPPYLTIADNPALSRGSSPFTVCCWVRIAVVDVSHGLITKNSSGVVDEYRLLIASNNIPTFVVSASIFSSKSVSWESALAASTWYFITAWHDPNAGQTGISVNNGTPVITSGFLASLDGPGDFYLGSTVFINRMNGLLDEVSLWKRILTSAELAHLYNDGNGRPYPFYDLRWAGQIYQAGFVAGQVCPRAS